MTTLLSQRPPRSPHLHAASLPPEGVHSIAWGGPARLTRKRLIMAHVRMLGIAAAVFASLLTCDPASDAVAPPLDRTLVVAVLRAPGAWFTGAARASSGVQDDLVAQYGSARGLAGSRGS